MAALARGDIGALLELPWQVAIVVISFASGVYAFVYATEGWTAKAKRQGNRPAKFARGRAWALLHAGAFAFGSWSVHGLATLFAPDQDWPYVALGCAAAASVFLQFARAWFVWRRSTETVGAASSRDVQVPADALTRKLAISGYGLLVTCLVAMLVVGAMGGGQGRPGDSYGMSVRHEERTSDLGTLDQEGTMGVASMAPGGPGPQPGAPLQLAANATWLKVTFTWQDFGPGVPPDVVLEVNANGSWSEADSFSAGTVYDWQDLNWSGAMVRVTVQPQAGTLPGGYMMHMHLLAHEVRDCTTRTVNGAPEDEQCGAWRGGYTSS